MKMWPLPKGIGDTANSGESLFLLSVVGPASSVSAGSVIASISTDVTYISALWAVETGDKLYKIRFKDGTGLLASDATLVVDRTSTGKLLSGATDLSGVVWRVMGIGTGPFASAVD
jgi:hypothetical protein